jgi:hypothetical protein
MQRENELTSTKDLRLLMSKFILVVLMFFSLANTLLAQNISGNNYVTVGDVNEYSFYDGSPISSPNWQTNHGYIESTWSFGNTYYARVVWTNVGTASLTVLNGYQGRGNLTVTVNAGPPPPTTFSYNYACEATTITRNSDPPNSTTRWYWQISNSATSAEYGYGASFTINYTVRVYLRERNASTGAWGALVTQAGNDFIPVTHGPGTPDFGAQRHVIGQGPVEVQLEVSEMTHATKYLWYEQSTGLEPPIEITPTPIYTATIMGNKTYYVAAANDYCISPGRRAVDAVLHPEPIVSVTNPTMLNNSPAELSVDNPIYSTYQWLNSFGQAIDGATSATYQTTLEGSYRVKVTIGNSPPFISSAVETNPPYRQGQNFIITNKVLAKNIVDENALETLPVDSVATTIAFFDGLGRPAQTLSMKASPSKKDIIQPFVYDQYDREYRKYLPYVSSEGNGIFKSGITDINDGYIGDAAGVYAIGSNNAIADDTRPYATLNYDDSPLNRINKKFGPGQLWFDNSKALQSNEFANINGTALGEERIIIWKLDLTGLPVQSGYYSSGQLAIAVTTDEEGNSTRVYKNKLGQEILKKVYASGSSSDLNSPGNWAQTYYIFDDFGNLSVVIPPEACRILIQD